MDRICFLWDVSTGRVIRRFQGHSHRINVVNMNDDCTVLITGSYDKTVKLWDLRAANSRDPIQTIENFKDSVTSLAKTNSEVIAGCVDGILRIFDIRAGRLYEDDQVEPITHVSLTHDRKCILSPTIGGRINLTELSTGQLLRLYQGWGIHNNLTYV